MNSLSLSLSLSYKKVKSLFLNKSFFKLALIVFCAGFLFFGFTANAFAATYYWVGGTTNSNTSNTANWKTTAGACADSANITLPGASDTVRFASGCVNNATVDSALSVNNFYMDTGYTGTTTINSTLTVATAFNLNAGTVKVSNGGTVSSVQVSVGADPGSNATVIIDGAGSVWTTNNAHFVVGNSGIGKLTISDGGVASTTGSGTVRLGVNSGSSGTVIITGAGSICNVYSYLQVGRGGTGTMTISNGGVAYSGLGYIGGNAGSVGSTTIDGAGSKWDTLYGSAMIVGNSGTGTLTIQNGGAVISQYGSIGNGIGSIGTTTIDGIGSSWTASNDFYIGDAGTGTLTLQNGAVANLTGIIGGTRTVYVANSAGSTGTLNIGAGYTTDVIQAANITAGLGTAAFPPAQPTALATTTVSATSIAWDWADAIRATGYKVYRTSDNTLLTTISSATSNWVQDSLSANTSSSIYIRGTNTQGEGASSTPASAYTSVPTPTNLSGTAGLTTMDLSVDAFTNPTAGTSGYYFSNSNGNNSGWRQTNSWQDTGLSCSTPYTYSVKYRNGDGTESSSVSIAKSTNNCGAVISLGQPIAQGQPQPTIISTSTPPLTITAEAAVVVPIASITPVEPVTPTSYARQWQNILVDAATISSGNLVTILSAAGEVRNIAAEASVATKYIANLISGLNALSDEVKNIITNFITYGTPTTLKLGLGERAGVINSFKTAFGKAPMTETDWRDCIAIGNGRWPNEKNAETETNAEVAFKKIYLRNADRNNSHDDSAVIIIAYGLRPINRNLNSERAAIKSFMAIYGYAPKSASAWDIVRAIAYSGAKR